MAIFNTVYKPKPYPTESVVYKMNADSNGNLYVPVAGQTTSGGYNAPYNWNVFVNGTLVGNYSGTGSIGGKITLSGYTSGTNYMIMIKPVTKDYGWARAYGWTGSTGKEYLTEVLYDGSYMGYGISATNTGNYFRASQYNRCPISKAPEEYIPDTVTTIGTYFRYIQYLYCTSLVSAPEDSLPNTVTSIGTDFREQQYAHCTSIVSIDGWKDLSIGAGSYRYNQFDTCTATKTVKVISNVGYGANGNYTLENSYVSTVYVPSAYLQNFIDTTVKPRSSITDSKFVGY